jgi:hypothetical protein
MYYIALIWNSNINLSSISVSKRGLKVYAAAYAHIHKGKDGVKGRDGEIEE